MTWVGRLQSSPHSWTQCLDYGSPPGPWSADHPSWSVPHSGRWHPAYSRTHWADAACTPGASSSWALSACRPLVPGRIACWDRWGPGRGWGGSRSACVGRGRVWPWWLVEQGARREGCTVCVHAQSRWHNPPLPQATSLIVSTQLPNLASPLSCCCCVTPLLTHKFSLLAQEYASGFAEVGRIIPQRGTNHRKLSGRNCCLLVCEAWREIFRVQARLCDPLNRRAWCLLSCTTMRRLPGCGQVSSAYPLGSGNIKHTKNRRISIQDWPSFIPHRRRCSQCVWQELETISPE